PTGAAPSPMMKGHGSPSRRGPAARTRLPGCCRVSASPRRVLSRNLHREPYRVATARGQLQRGAAVATADQTDGVSRTDFRAIPVVADGAPVRPVLCLLAFRHVALLPCSGCQAAPSRAPDACHPPLPPRRARVPPSSRTGPLPVRRERPDPVDTAIFPWRYHM